MKIHQLRYFVAIAENSSLRSAAKSLGLAQPALSRGLRELEDWLGLPLVERSSSGIRLTVGGERFLVRARSALEDLRRAEDEAAQLRGEQQGTLTVGLSPALQLLLLPQAYQAFRKEFPAVSLTVRSSESLLHLERYLDDGTMDFCIVPRLSGDAEYPFRIDNLWNAERVLLARKGHPLGRTTSLRNFSDSEWIILGRRGPAEKYLQSIFLRHDYEPPRRFVCVDSIISAMNFLQFSDAVFITALFFTAVSVFRDSHAAVPLREPIDPIDIMLVRKRNLPLTPAADCLLTHLRRSAMSKKLRGVRVL